MAAEAEAQASTRPRRCLSQRSHLLSAARGLTENTRCPPPPPSLLLCTPSSLRHLNLFVTRLLILTSLNVRTGIMHLRHPPYDIWTRRASFLCLPLVDTTSWPCFFRAISFHSTVCCQSLGFAFMWRQPRSKSLFDALKRKVGYKWPL